MRDALRRLANGVRLAITRGKVLQSSPGRRTMVQVGLLAGEVKNGVELLLPYGMSALPAAGDVLALQILGSRDHMVVLCSDDTSLRITDLQATEFGFRDARVQQIVFRHDRVEITTPLKVVVTAGGEVDVSAGSKVNVTAATDVDVTATGTVNVAATTGAVNVTAATAVNLTAPAISLGSAGETLHKLVNDQFVALFNSHIHIGVAAGSGVSGISSISMDATMETSVVSAG